MERDFIERADNAIKELEEILFNAGYEESKIEEILKPLKENNRRIVIMLKIADKKDKNKNV